ncbi:VOC family protein [Halobacillus sp. Marseille-P3879]|uniref:VOC family protein n=1 Tax=Halobacillus sp. Marseille-P3879 TaxID=2045014 RepID=UPI000C7D52DD|nr:VOC family protein [Halobacillus sp. Marseille-P3879]
MITGIHPYLVLDGRGQEAINFYKEALDAEITELHTFDDMPEDPDFSLPEGAAQLVMNAQLKVGGTELFMLSDIFPGMPYQLGSQVTVALIIDEKAQAKVIFDNLKDGGEIGMELQETFWSPAYGQVTDKFGVSWQISTEQSNHNV